ncbi:hypothetical protein LTR37_006044 [Vermiconidia calcicola]|uniref:Uncharacterized protein n=1 Tax=Vermiconidia calcicola TaxID=1690605 RepID=A0ACC3NHZ3_9PEZI|nr:hypothetical protein LTR37_006044 [Vermiconidia calcicola]
MSQSRKTNFIIDQKELPRPPTDHQGPCSTTRYWVRKVSIALWLWEFASLFLSTLCMGTIGVILIQYNNRPIAVWSYGLTMNGVIFILAVIAKSSLILPLAEALSQLKWCWFSGHQRPVMDFDRFDLAGRGPMGSLAMLAHLRFWRGIGALGAALTRKRQGHAYMCNWELHLAEYTSLGVCSACQDIMPALKWSSRYGATGWELPNPWDDVVYRNDLNLYIGTAVWQFEPEPNQNYSYAFRPVQHHTILDMISIYWPPGPVPRYAFHQPNEAAWNRTLLTPPSGAFECMLYFCVQNYTAQVVEGKFQESIVSTWPPANQSLPHDRPWDQNFDYTVNGNFTLTPPSQRDSFSVDLLNLYLMRRWAGDTFVGTVKTTPANSGGILFEDDIAQAFFDEQTRSIGPPQYLHNYSVPTTAGPKPILDKIAASMTTYIREIAGSEVAVGKAYSLETIVHARWYYAIFPTVLLLLTFAFMISTIIVSARRTLPVWKSSSLGTLMHGIDDSSTKAIAASRLYRMEEKADMYSMRLPLPQDDWKLRVA